MSQADELKKLSDLYAAGAISQAEYEAAKARLLGSTATGNADFALNRLRLSDTDRWIGGVCGGIATLTGVESWIWRIAFVLGLCIGGFTAAVYLILWIFVPRQVS